MPQPTVYESHVDRPLTNISIAYIQDQDHFVSSKVFPMLSVAKRSDQYYTFTQADWFRDEARPRAEATESAGSGYNLSTGSYLCNKFALHKDVDDDVVENSDNPLQPYADATRFVTHKMLLKQETEWISAYFATSLWGRDRTGATHFTQWNNMATSDPINDIEAGKEYILNNTGFMPNTLVMGYQVYRQLKQNPEIVDRLKHTMPIVGSTVGETLLASMLGIERVLVAKSVYDTTDEGSASASYSFFHGKNALLCYVAPSPSLLTPTAGYKFVWTGISQGIGTNVGIKRFRMEELNADRIEGQMAWDDKLVGSNLGYYFSAAVA